MLVAPTTIVNSRQAFTSGSSHPKAAWKNVLVGNSLQGTA